MPSLLLTWSDRGLGARPLSHQRARSGADRGPVMRLLDNSDTDYDEAWVLTVPAGKSATATLAAELDEVVPTVRTVPVPVDDPSDYRALFDALTDVQAELSREKLRDGWTVDVLLSAGTPQAQTLWVILVQSGLLPARMLQVIAPAFVPDPHPKPVREVRLDIEGFPTIVALRAEVARLRSAAGLSAKRLVGESEAWRALMRRVARVAESDVPVLVLGETGTGKELIAQSIHQASARRGGPFIAENCGALDEGVLASELFGHEAGAFTGAKGRRRGLFEQAHGGTLFLDEVGEMPPRVQSSLLRVLQEGQLRRVGGERTVSVDGRVIAATHKNLRSLVDQGKFREDLFFRLYGATLELPPLRERPDDIALLVRAFLEELDSRLELSVATMRALEQYSWPGNVRELRAEVTRWTVFCDGRVEPGDLSSFVVQGEERGPEVKRGGRKGKIRPLAVEVEATERVVIGAALKRFGENLSQTARALGVDRNTLKRKVRRYGLL